MNYQVTPRPEAYVDSDATAIIVLTLFRLTTGPTVAPLVNVPAGGTIVAWILIVSELTTVIPAKAAAVVRALVESWPAVAVVKIVAPEVIADSVLPDVVAGMKLPLVQAQKKAPAGINVTDPLSTRPALASSIFSELDTLVLVTLLAWKGATA